MTRTEAQALADRADAAHDVACQAYRDAERALKRSKSAANRAAFAKASDALDAVSEAAQAAQDVLARACRREECEERLAARAARRASLAIPTLQLEMF